MAPDAVGDRSSPATEKPRRAIPAAARMALARREVPGVRALAVTCAGGISAAMPAILRARNRTICSWFTGA
jgi:hypothetical protein